MELSGNCIVLPLTKGRWQGLCPGLPGFEPVTASSKRKLYKHLRIALARYYLRYYDVGQDLPKDVSKFYRFRLNVRDLRKLASHVDTEDPDLR